MLLKLLAEGVPLLDQGSVQFILLTVMILIVCFLIWSKKTRTWPFEERVVLT